MPSIELENFVDSYEAFQKALSNLHIATEDLTRAGLGRDFENDVETLMRRVDDMVDDFKGHIFYFVDDRVADWKILADRRGTDGKDNSGTDR